jgi:hypothetical protein
MKILSPALVLTLGALALASSPRAQAQSVIAAWNFDSLSAGTNLDPTASTDITGSASSSSVGMSSSGGNFPTANATGPDTSNINVEAGTDTVNNNTSTSNQEWRIVGTNGWNSGAAIGSQGAQFGVSTTGYTSIALSFDMEITSQGEANVQVEYTTNGSIWQNAAIAFTGASGVVLNNPSSGGNANIVTGSYLHTDTSSGSNLWFNQITANFSGIGGLSNDPNFAIRIVNAATGSANVALKGNTAINNTSGNWRVDNVIFTGTAIPEPATWALFAGIAALLLAVVRRRGVRFA